MEKKSSNPARFNARINIRKGRMIIIRYLRIVKIPILIVHHDNLFLVFNGFLYGIFYCIYVFSPLLGLLLAVLGKNLLGSLELDFIILNSVLLLFVVHAFKEALLFLPVLVLCIF